MNLSMQHYVKPLLPFGLGWGVLLVTPGFEVISLLNGVGQLLLFALLVCLPAWKTGRLSYVDIGWPFGLVLIGLVTLLCADGYGLRKIVVSLVYMFIGLRMGLGAVRMWRRGLFQTEFPRYRYQRRRWERDGVDNIPLMMQVEALVQGLANASYLAFPALVIASNSSEEFALLEIVGLLLWLGAFAMETVADLQKQKFLRQAKSAGLKSPVCNVGLWRYSRHPNYFAEWMVWNALVVASIPSWLDLYSEIPVILWLLLGLGLLFTSRCMYVTLVHYTGAKPAEFYSVQKRPEYKDYQETTNMFFPGPTKAR